MGVGFLTAAEGRSVISLPEEGHSRGAEKETSRMHGSEGIPSGRRLAVEVRRDGETLVISPRGELDISTTQALEVELRKGLDGDVPEVILDLRGVSFIDSTGVRLLVFAAAHSRSKGDRLRMLRGSEEVERRLLVSGLERSLPFLD